MSIPNKQSILFVSGLDRSVNENLLYQTFNEFPISYIKIAKDHSTRDSYGYAFVGFKSQTKADEALAKLNYTKLNKKTIRISWYNREPNNYRNNPDYNIFIKKIPKSVSPKEFHDHFLQFGNIVSAKLVEDDEGEPIGYGFVLYDTPDSANRAIAATHDKEFHGKKLWVGKFEKNRPKKPIEFNNIYVRNIPKSFDKNSVEAHFSRYGAFGSIILEAPSENSINSNIPNEKKIQILDHKYAFICFKNPKSAKQAVNEVPFYKLTDNAYNEEMSKLVSIVKTKDLVPEDHFHRFACYAIENVEDYKQILKNDENVLKRSVDDFRRLMIENDETYVIKDKSDRMDCCQALKKKEREKKLKTIYEKIKKQIKEKYKLCNLYVKNLPDNYDDEQLRDLFQKYGEIRSCKTIRKELLTSYLGIRRTVKVFGYVCFTDKASAHDAKKELHDKPLLNNHSKLYVEYHQTKTERAEFLKIKMINKSNKVMQNTGKMDMFPPNMIMRNMPNMRQFPNNVFGPQMLRKFPAQTQFVKPNFNSMNVNTLGGMMPMEEFVDKNSKKDFYGDRLYTKISSSPQYSHFSEYHSKIVGIFLDLEDPVIERLINDDSYFQHQVLEAVRLLNIEKGSG